MFLDRLHNLIRLGDSFQKNGFVGHPFSDHDDHGIRVDLEILLYDLGFFFVDLRVSIEQKEMSVRDCFRYFCICSESVPLGLATWAEIPHEGNDNGSPESLAVKLLFFKLDPFKFLAFFGW